jgi:hypothetical protein
MIKVRMLPNAYPGPVGADLGKFRFEFFPALDMPAQPLQQIEDNALMQYWIIFELRRTDEDTVEEHFSVNDVEICRNYGQEPVTLMLEMVIKEVLTFEEGAQLFCTGKVRVFRQQMYPEPPK